MLSDDDDELLLLQDANRIIQLCNTGTAQYCMIVGTYSSNEDTQSLEVQEEMKRTQTQSMNT